MAAGAIEMMQRTVQQLVVVVVVRRAKHGADHHARRDIEARVIPDRVVAEAGAIAASGQPRTWG